MDKNKIEHFKNRLLKEKKNVMNILKTMKEHQPTGLSLKEYTGELSFYDNHPADYGSELFITTMQTNLGDHQRYRIAEIDKALEKIEDGTYGSCQLCGANIPEERLKLMPEVSICIKCAEDRL